MPVAGLLEFGNKRIDLGAPLYWHGKRVEGADVHDHL
jgi:hypothetical protein